MGEDDYWIVKLNAFGEIEWQNTIGGDRDDFLFTVQQNTDMEIDISNYASGMYFVKLYVDGNEITQKLIIE